MNKKLAIISYSLNAICIVLIFFFGVKVFLSSSQCSSLTYVIKMNFMPNSVAAEREKYTGWWQTWDNNLNLKSFVYLRNGTPRYFGIYPMHDYKQCVGVRVKTFVGRTIDFRVSDYGYGKTGYTYSDETETFFYDNHQGENPSPYPSVEQYVSWTNGQYDEQICRDSEPYHGFFRYGFARPTYLLQGNKVQENVYISSQKYMYKEQLKTTLPLSLPDNILTIIK